MQGIQGIAPCLWFDNQAEEAWQVVPRVLVEMMSDPDAEKAGRAMKTMLQMKKIDIAELKCAYAG